jgi:hypothetical protein
VKLSDEKKDKTADKNKKDGGNIIKGTVVKFSPAFLKTEHNRKPNGKLFKR